MIDLDFLEEPPPRPMTKDRSPLGSICRTFPDVLGAITVNLSDSSVSHNFQPYGKCLYFPFLREVGVKITQVLIKVIGQYSLWQYTIIIMTLKNQ